MNVYQHDSADAFRFVLSGDLSGAAVPQLEWAWTTAVSVLSGRPLIVDITGMSGADAAGTDLLSRMKGSGARFTGALPPAAQEYGS